MKKSVNNPDFGRKNDLKFASELVKAFSMLSSEVMSSGPSSTEEDAVASLRAVTSFYEVDWCGVITVDPLGKGWKPFWWYSANSETEEKCTEWKLKFCDKYWNKMILEERNLVVSDVRNCKKADTELHELLSYLNAENAMIVCFDRKVQGLLIVKNVRKFVDNFEFLRLQLLTIPTQIRTQMLMDVMK